MLLNLLMSVLLVTTLDQAPAGWEAFSRRAQQLILDHKTTEAIALLEKGAKDHPAFDGAHYELAEAHRMLALELAMNGPSRDSERLQHLETAAAHYERAARLAGQYETLAWGHLLQLYGADELNKPAEAVRAARRYIQLRPSSAIGHVTLARALRATAQEGAAIAALLDARKAVAPEDAPLLATTAVDFVLTTSLSETADLTGLLDYADPVLDRAMAADPGDRRVVLTKAAALKARAEKVERDPGRRAALTKESERLFDRFSDMNPSRSAEIPPPPPPTDAASQKYAAAVTLFEKFRRDKSMPAADARNTLGEARAALDEALKLKPEYLDAIVYKSLVLRSLSELEPDPAAAKALAAEADRLRAQATAIIKKKSGGD